MLTALPVLMALSWIPIDLPAAPAAAPVQESEQAPQATETIKCPLTGQSIPSCCCPIK